MEANPYAAPAAVVEDVADWSADDLEARKTSRGRRLGAALLDGLINLLWLLSLIWAFTMSLGVRHGLTPASPMIGMYLFSLAVAVATIIVNGIGSERRCLHDMIADTIVVDV